MTFPSPYFYTTFWQLSLYDISVPVPAYSQEVSKVTLEIKKKDADRTDMTPPAIQRRRREREQLQTLIDQLNQEFKTQTSAFQATKNRLSQEKDLWFDWEKLPSSGETVPPRNKTVLAILQHCVIPRCLFGPNEAIFSAKFIREMHRLGTKNFSSLTLYDKVRNLLLKLIKIFVNLNETVVFTCTNKEAENYGRFLREVLSELMRWFNDKSVYEKEAVGLSIPGFLKKWSVNAAETIYLQYEEYRSVMFKWHKNLTMAFRNCLESRDYMHVRNSLAVLEKLVGLYPLVDFHGAALEEKVAIVAGKTETRGDLQIRAQGYLAILRKSSKSWVPASTFSSQPKPSNISVSSTSPTPSSSPRNFSPSSTTQGRQQPTQSFSTLNPAASPFKPPLENTRYLATGCLVLMSRGKDGNSQNVDVLGTQSPQSSSSAVVVTPFKDSEAGGHSEKSANRHEQSASLKVAAQDAGMTPSQSSNSGINLDNSSVSKNAQSFVGDLVPQPDFARNGLPRATTDAVTSPRSQLHRTSQGGQNETQSLGRRSEELATTRVGISSAELRLETPTRPRTPEGPRNGSMEPVRNDIASRRSPTVRDSQTRSLRGETSRPIADKSSNGFRAPPPTGPRATSTSASISSMRTQHAVRVSSGSERSNGASAGAAAQSATSLYEHSERSTASTTSGGLSRSILNPGRPGSSTVSGGEATKHSRSNTTMDSHTSRRSAPAPSQLLVGRRESALSVEIPRGPSDRRYRSKRDPLDEDPRRLSRTSENWGDASHGVESSARIEDRRMPAIADSSAALSRDSAVEKVEDDSFSGTVPSSRELRTAQVQGEGQDENKPSDGTKPRDEREPSTDQSRTQNSKLSGSANNRDDRKESSLAVDPPSSSREGQSAERRAAHRTKPELSSHSEGRPAPTKDQRTSDSREASPRTRADRTSTSRNVKDESKDSRHGARESHHRRTTRRSPSRTSDRKERERGTDRLSAVRRENKDFENREREKITREEGSRREGRERDRISRDRDRDDRRSSRKHDRERSADASGKYGRSGEERSTADDPNSPVKRRRVAR